jgi:hypothetical protein
LLLGVGLSAFSRLHASPDTVILSAAAFGIGAAGLLLAGAIPTGGARMGLVARRALVAVLAVALIAVLIFQASYFLGFSELEAQHYHKAMGCFEHALFSGVVASSALMFLWKRCDPFSPSLSGAFLGLVGGLVGTLSIGLTCANDEGLHLTVGHGLAAFILSIVGAYAGSKWLAP